MITFKSDRYRQARGGYSRFLKLTCRRCKTEVLTYQKDGSGTLERLYLDRIIAPKRLVDLQKKQLQKIPDLTCPHCKSWIAVPYMYKKESRKAYKLFVGAIDKKVTKA